MKILIVDDHKVLRQGLTRLMSAVFPGSEISEASNGIEALELLNNLAVDVVLLDVQMPKLNGPETLKRIKELYPDLKVIMLTQFAEPALVAHCLHLGTNGFLLKDVDIDEVELAISKVLSEGNYFSPFVVDLLRKKLYKNSSLANLELSVSEYQIISMLKDGLGTKDIARKLGLTVYTVDSYRRDLLRKTKVKNVAELISLAYRTGLVTNG